MRGSTFIAFLFVCCFLIVKEACLHPVSSSEDPVNGPLPEIDLENETDEAPEEENTSSLLRLEFGGINLLQDNLAKTEKNFEIVLSTTVFEFEVALGENELPFSASIRKPVPTKHDQKAENNFYVPSFELPVGTWKKLEDSEFKCVDETAPCKKWEFDFAQYYSDLSKVKIDSYLFLFEFTNEHGEHVSMEIEIILDFSDSKRYLDDLFEPQREEPKQQLAPVKEFIDSFDINDEFIPINILNGSIQVARCIRFSPIFDLKFLPNVLDFSLSVVGGILKTVTESSTLIVSSPKYSVYDQDSLKEIRESLFEWFEHASFGLKEYDMVLTFTLRVGEKSANWRLKLKPCPLESDESLLITDIREIFKTISVNHQEIDALHFSKDPDTFELDYVSPRLRFEFELSAAYKHYFFARSDLQLIIYLTDNPEKHSSRHTYLNEIKKYSEGSTILYLSHSSGRKPTYCEELNDRDLLLEIGIIADETETHKHQIPFRFILPRYMLGDKCVLLTNDVTDLLNTASKYKSIEYLDMIEEYVLREPIIKRSIPELPFDPKKYGPADWKRECEDRMPKITKMSDEELRKLTYENSSIEHTFLSWSLMAQTCSFYLDPLLESP